MFEIKKKIKQTKNLCKNKKYIFFVLNFYLIFVIL